MKKLLLDFCWFLLFTIAVGFIEWLFKLLFGWALTWNSTIQALFIFIGIPTFGGILGMGAGLIASIPFKTWFWLILAEIMLLLELIGGIFGIWGKWWWSETTGWDIAIKVVATLFFLFIFVGGGICLAGGFTERRNG